MTGIERRNRNRELGFFGELLSREQVFILKELASRTLRRGCVEFGRAPNDLQVR